MPGAFAKPACPLPISISIPRPLTSRTCSPRGIIPQVLRRRSKGCNIVLCLVPKPPFRHSAFSSFGLWEEGGCALHKARTALPRRPPTPSGSSFQRLGKEQENQNGSWQSSPGVGQTGFSVPSSCTEMFTESCKLFEVCFYPTWFAMLREVNHNNEEGLQSGIKRPDPV